MHRTQFDPQLLIETAASLVCRNHGRQLVALEDGSVLTALAWGGDAPVLRVWKGHELVAEHRLAHEPTAPVLLTNGQVWLSIGDQVCRAAAPASAPVAVDGCTGQLEDAVVNSGGEAILAVRRGASLLVSNGRQSQIVDNEVGHAALDLDESGRLHLVYEKRHGIEYRQFENMTSVRAERIAEAFGSEPTVVTHAGKVFVGYLGESWRPPKADEALWKAKGRQRRLGLGGYVAALVRENERWRRFTLAASKQFAKPLWPKTRNFGYDYPSVDVRVRLDEFSAPSLTLGPDGVVQVTWANTARRWVFTSRFLGEDFSPPAEVRGPVEELTGPCLLPKFVVPRMLSGLAQIPPEGGTTNAWSPFSNAIPLAMITKTRTYLDALRLPSREIQSGRRIDFVQPDELAVCRGLELKANPMQRFDGNPVMRTGEPGSFDELGLSATFSREGAGWRAHVLSKSASKNWRREFPATSADGIHWKRAGQLPEELAVRAVRYLEDPDQPDPARRFKGLWLKPGAPWGTFVPVTSSGAENWTVVADVPPIMCDEDLFVWKDDADIPERRFKATGCARSFCGRVCAQWVSADAIHEELPFQ